MFPSILDTLFWGFWSCVLALCVSLLFFIHRREFSMFSGLVRDAKINDPHLIHSCFKHCLLPPFQQEEEERDNCSRLHNAIVAVCHPKEKDLSSPKVPRGPVLTNSRDQLLLRPTWLLVLHWVGTLYPIFQYLNWLPRLWKT